MKKRINIILAFFLVISVCANVFFIKSCIDAKDQAETLSRQATITDETINELNSNLSDLENQLTDSMEQIKILEDSLAEMQESAALDDNTVFEGNGAGANFIISEDFPYVDREADTEQPPAESQEQQQQETQPVSTPIPQQPQSINPMPTRPDGGGVPDAPTGTGTGAAPGTLGVGTFE